MYNRVRQYCNKLFLATSEDNTTHYWREQQARGKLQIADETEQRANEYKKVSCYNKHNWMTPLVR
jgi:hypothetical protein